MSHSQEEREPILRDLVSRIRRWSTPGKRCYSQVPGLSLFQVLQPTPPLNVIVEPSICLIAQGAKELLVGDDTFAYDTERYLITSVHMPTITRVAQASEERPYFGLRLVLDSQLLHQLVADSQLPAPRVSGTTRGIFTGTVSLSLLNGFQRLLELLDEPEDIPILAPTISREIIYRLLVGDQGARLRQMAAQGSLSHQVARATEWLKANFAESLDVDELATWSEMSRSSFYQHFRAVTAMSPLQYQKQIRLHEARRLMLTEDLDAASAAHRVGYGSPSQFSREYSRQFGASPTRDVAELRRLTVS